MDNLNTTIPMSKFTIVGTDGSIINVPVEEPTLIEKNITEPGQYNASDDNADGYSSVSVEIQNGEGDGEFLVQVIDYDGTVLKKKYLNTGDTFELPETPPEHERLVFDGWSSPVDITDNVIIVEDQDLNIGPMYHTTSGKTEIDIELLAERKTFTVYLILGQTIEWGDGTSETASVDGYVTHEYSDYGNYTVMISGSTTYIQENIFNLRIDNSSTFKTDYTVKNIFLNKGIITIKDYAFINCKNLQTVVIPNSVTTMRTDIFNSCYNLQAVVLPNSLNSVGPYNSTWDGNIFMNCYNLKTVVIPNSILCICRCAFYGCESLQSVTIPKSVVILKGCAFQDCYNLKRINIPFGISTISTQEFSSCNNLKSVTIPNSVTIIYDSAFSSCKNLQSLVIPESVIDVSNGVLSNCNNLKSVTIPKSLAKIGNMFLKNCYRIMSFDHYYKPITTNEMFINAYNIVTIKGPDLIDTTSVGSMFTNCYNLTNLEIYNIKTSLQIGSGTTWGHLLTLDSLLHTIKELHDMTGESASKELTVGSANLEKLANVYVKLITITDEMRAEDEYVDNKKPFVVCESTDEGAMTVSDYSRLIKNWIIK